MITPFQLGFLGISVRDVQEMRSKLPMWCSWLDSNRAKIPRATGPCHVLAKR